MTYTYYQKNQMIIPYNVTRERVTSVQQVMPWHCFRIFVFNSYVFSPVFYKHLLCSRIVLCCLMQQFLKWKFEEVDVAVEIQY